MPRKRNTRKRTTYKKKRTSYKRKGRSNYRRRGKINPWVKGAIAAAAPSILATGYGAIKHLLRDKYAGYSNIYA